MFDAVLFITGAFVAWTLVYEMRRWARQLRLNDVPNHRSMHRQATPHGGGAALVAVCLVGFVVAAAYGQGPERPEGAAFLTGALLIGGVSFVDDVRTVPYGIRLAVQMLGAALIVVALGIGSQRLPGLGWQVLALGLLGTVWLTNAYNFMDGIDGLAATQGIVAGLGWALLAYLSHQPWLEILGLLVAASCAGFLVHNWPPARIFMGDLGSTFLGFTFAFMTLAAFRRAPALAVAGIMLLWPFAFDATFTLVRRVGRGENIFVAHRTHLYQRLVMAGWNHAAVTSLYGVFAVVMLLLGVAWWLAGPTTFLLFPIVAVVFLLSVGLLIVVLQAERRVTNSQVSTLD